MLKMFYQTVLNLISLNLKFKIKKYISGISLKIHNAPGQKFQEIFLEIFQERVFDTLSLTVF